MKYLYLKCILLCLSVVFCTSSFAYDCEVNGIYYNLNNKDNTASVTNKPDGGYYEGTVVIPSSIIYEGTIYSVTEIGNSAFKGCTGLTTVKIPNSVTSLSDNAFSSCTGLTSVTIPNSVTYIGYWTFYGCSGLTSLTIGDGVTTIGGHAFRKCSSLRSLIIPSKVNSIEGNSAFWGCSSLISLIVDKNNPYYDSREDCNAIIKTAYNMLIAGCSQTIIPNSVTSIDSYAFFQCTGLTTLVIPNSVTSIGTDAFNGCSGLTTLVIPNSVTSIGADAFCGCSGLTSVTIPNSVTYIGNLAFCGCDNFTSITVERTNPLDISNEVFTKKAYQLGVLYVPKGREQYYKNATGWKNFVHVEEIDMETSLSPFSDIGANQMILGYYRTGEYNSTGIHYGGANEGTYKVCIGFKKEKIEPFVGNKITHVRFALVNTDITDAKIWISNARDGEALYTQRVPSLTTGWNEVKLDNAFEIMEDSILIGLEYYQNEKNYPISCVSTGAEFGSSLFYGPYGNEKEYKWIDRDNTNLSIQCLIEGEKIPEYDIHTIDFHLNDGKEIVKNGQEVSGNLHFKSWGKKVIENYELSCLLDGVEVTSRSGSMLGGASISSCHFSFTPRNLAPGKHTISITVKSINGEKPTFTSDDTQSAVFKIYANDMGRQKVLEEMHTATWCPSSIRYLMNHEKEAQVRNDVVYVAIHHSDGLSSEVGDLYGVFSSTTPIAHNNRHAYQGETSLSFISLDEGKEMPAFANVNISADYNDKDCLLKIKVIGERNVDFVPVEEYTYLTVLLTEDDVVYPQYDGENKKYIYDYKHQGVLRTNISNVWGDPIVWDGDKYEMNYTVILDEDWVKDNMKIVAFLAKPFNGSNYDEIYVVNCNDFALKDATTVDIEDVVASRADSFDVYSPSGVIVKQNATSLKGLPKGVYIANGKKMVVNK